MSPGRKRTGSQALLNPFFNAARQAWKEYGTLAIIALGLLTLALGYIGFEHYAAMQGLSLTPFDLFYMTLKAFPINSFDAIPPGIWELQVVRFLAPAFTLLALLRFVSALFSRQLQQLRLRFIRGHVVVCGMNPMGLELVKDFRAAGWPVAVVDPDPEGKEAEHARDLGALVIEGDPAALPALMKARIAAARYLFAITDNDSLNSEIAMAARACMDSRGKGSAFLTCFAHIVNSELCSLLQEQQMSAGSHRYALELFNVFQIAGQHISLECPPFPAQADPPDCHVLIVSPGLMGETLIYDAVKQWKKAYGSAKKMKVTMLERDAGARAQGLRLRYPALDRFCDLVPVDSEPGAKGFDYDSVLLEGDRFSVTQVYVCLEEQSIGLAIALQINRCMLDFAARRGVEKPEVQVVMRTTGDGMSKLFGHMSGVAGSFDNLYAFPLIERSCNIDYLTGGLNETIAMAIHEDYARRQRAKGETPDRNPSVRDWDDLAETLKVSNRNQAIHIHRKLRSIGCEITRASDWEENTFSFGNDEVQMLARMEHERFVKERQMQGWRYGLRKDVEKKTSPYLVPYDELSEEIKDLDRDAVRALPAVLEQADLKIIRLRKDLEPDELPLENELVSRN